jgi:hypothetical protein
MYSKKGNPDTAAYGLTQLDKMYVPPKRKPLHSSIRPYLIGYDVRTPKKETLTQQHTSLPNLIRGTYSPKRKP